MSKIITEISKDILRLAPRIQNELTNGFRRIKGGRKIEYESEGPNPQDMATELDHKIGVIYINEIFRKYQGQIKIDSEEERERIGDGPITLRFDPLDGTKHFFKGIPMIASTAGLVENGITKFSMVLDVFAGNLYHAYKDQGAYINGGRINVSKASIGDDFSFVMYESPNSKMYLNNPESYGIFTKQVDVITQGSYRMRNFGLSSLSICLVADGSCPAYIDFSGTTKLYDVEAAAMIALEAGAIVGDISGNKSNNLDHDTSGKRKIKDNLLVANPIAFGEITKILSED